MVVEFQCQCGHAFRTQTQNIGRRIVCPNCLKESVVPGAASSSKVQSRSDAIPPKAPPPIPDQQARRATTQLGHRNVAEIDSPAKPAGTKLKKDDKRLKERSERDVKGASKAKRSSDQKASSNNSDNPFDLSEIESMDAPEDEVELVEDFEEPFDEPPVSRKKKRKKSKSADDEVADEKVSKKKPKRDSNSNGPLIVGGIVSVVLVLAMILVIPAISSAVKQSGKIQLPDEYEAFENQDINFRCQMPKGWDADSRGGSGNIPPSVKIEKGRFKITYRSSISGAAIQDMAQAGSAHNNGEESDDQKPVYRVHQYQSGQFKQATPNHKESGPPEMIKTGWGEGCLSEFTSTANFGKRIFGYRATLLTAQYQWNVVCTCPTKREFDAFKPVFRKVIESTGN